MYPSQRDHFVAQEQYQDLLREAALYRLMHAAVSKRPANDRLPG